MAEALFHGGIRRLDRKGLILPPTRTGSPSNADYGAGSVCRRDRVYLTTEIDQARIFACLAPGRCGDIYEVEPLGDLEVDPDYHGPGESWQAPMARIVCVVERNVTKVSGLSRQQLAVERTPDGEFYSSGRRAQSTLAKQLEAAANDAQPLEPPNREEAASTAAPDRRSSR